MLKIPSLCEPIGYAALVSRFDLKVLSSHRWSFVRQKGERKEYEEDGRQIHLYSKSYALENPDDVFGHIKFALKHEGLNLEILYLVLQQVRKDAVTTFITGEQTGRYARLVWFLYESFFDVRLPIEDLTRSNYVPLLDPDTYYTGAPQRLKRYRLIDNLLGPLDFAPVVRRTDALKEFEEKRLNDKCRELIEQFAPFVLKRALNFLYTKETLSSFEIERERPGKKRSAKFMSLLENAHVIDVLSKETLIEIQNNIVDERFKDTDYRDTQNYVGQQIGYEKQKLHYIPPKPEDVESLMQSFIECSKRLLDSEVDPVIVAAVISFSFVFIHPFDDGNGRAHRFLIHAIFARMGYTPPGVIFPVSAVMLNQLYHYDKALEGISVPLINAIDKYTLTDTGKLTIKQETKHHYQYMDMTHLAEYLFSCVEQTIENDFKQELEFIASYDDVRKALREIVDLPDKLLDLFISCSVQNGGNVSTKKRLKHFAMLTSEELNQMEQIVFEMMFS